MPSDASLPQSGGIVDVDLSGRVKNPARKVQISTVWVQSTVVLLLL